MRLNTFFRHWSWWDRSLAIALVVSLTIHVGILIWQPKPKAAEETRLKTPLSVVLVNSQSALSPLKPKKLAQNDLNGGGQSSDDSEATVLAKINPGMAKQLEDLQKEQNRLIAVVHEQEATSKKSRTGKNALEQEEAQLLEAQLAKILQTQSSQPRKAILTATSAKAVIYAQYYDAMRKKVEAYGTKFFPRNAQGPIYGSLIVLISVDKTGKIISKPKIEKSSGNVELDQQAIAIVNACAPFGAFSPAMMAKLDIIDWIATFDFVPGKGQSQLELGTTTELPPSKRKSKSDKN
jgi:protein TonB